MFEKYYCMNWIYLGLPVGLEIAHWSTLISVTVIFVHILNRDNNTNLHHFKNNNTCIKYWKISSNSSINSLKDPTEVRLVLVITFYNCIYVTIPFVTVLDKELLTKLLLKILNHCWFKLFVVLIMIFYIWNSIEGKELETDLSLCNYPLILLLLKLTNEFLVVLLILNIRCIQLKYFKMGISYNL